jgi:DNA-binding LacI/PurR family transcriptional regulator
MTGASVSTVSRVLNNNSPTCASKELKDKIWRAAHEINYIPNQNACSLKSGEKQKGAYQVAVVLARISNLDDDPFFREVFRSLETELFSKNILLSAVVCAEAPPDFNISKADGIIILGRCSEKLLSALKAVTPNLVGIWRNVQNFNIDEIVCDGKKAATTAVDHLISLGHTKIAYIGDCSYESRYVGYCETLINHRLPIDYRIIIPTNQTEHEGSEAMKILSGAGEATAVLCANDITAIGVLKSLKEQKIKNMSVISIDNIEEAYNTNPMLTTVNISREDMAHMAVSVLYDRIQHKHKEFMRIEFPCRIIQRESCYKK